MGYAVGHYARWLTRGAIRIAAASENPRVVVTGFRDQAAGRIVVVVVNNETTEQLLRVRASGASPLSQATGEASYGSVRWEAIPAFAAAPDGDFELTAPAKSVLSIGIPFK